MTRTTKAAAIVIGWLLFQCTWLGLSVALKLDDPTWNIGFFLLSFFVILILGLTVARRIR